jgi:hypothetical protein
MQKGNLITRTVFSGSKFSELYSFPQKVTVNFLNLCENIVVYFTTLFQ